MVWESEQCPGEGQAGPGVQGNQTGTQHRPQVPSCGMGTAGVPSLGLSLILTPMEAAAS